MYMLEGFLLIAVGAVSGQLAKFVDFMLDYGHVFGRVRHWLAVKAAHGNEHLTRTLAGAVKQTDFSNRLRTVNDVYWLIAAYKSWFVLVMCVVCMSTYLWAIGYLVTVLVIGASWKVALLVFPASIALNYTIAKHGDL